MNYIKQLQNENIELKQSIDNAIETIIEFQKYFSGTKFQGFENDFAHVSTDIIPKLFQIKNQLSQ